MNEKGKKSIGQIIWILARPSYTLRKILLPLGMRTKKKWYKNRTGTIRLVNNKRVRLTNLDKNYLTFELFWKGWTYYEPLSILLFRELLKGTDEFLDIGANVGYFSICAASEREGLRITSFEPNPKLYEILKENVSANGFNISCESAALSERSGTAKFFLPESDMSATLDGTFNKTPVNLIDAPTISLDDFVAEHRISGRLLLKVDVEGYEPQVIRGALKTLKKHHPDIILEVVKDYDEETENLLKDRGYSFHQITNTGLHQSDNLAVCRRDGFLFSNYLITTRSREDVGGLFDAIRNKVNAIDLKTTSLHRSHS